MSKSIRIGIAGAAGRMGVALVRAIAEEDSCNLGAALEARGHKALGKDANRVAGLAHAGIFIGVDEATFLGSCNVVIDFTTPEATAARAAAAAEKGAAFVTGTTGLSEEQMAALKTAAEKIPVVWAANMSVGVNLLLHLVRNAARALDSTWDIEIIEMHHRDKRDAPSGTALALGRTAAEARGIDPDENAVRVRNGDIGPRKPSTIGYATLRGGDVVGDHSVVIAGAGERLELAHRATDRKIFARGAVRAAIWAADRENGFHSMADVLGLPR